MFGWDNDEKHFNRMYQKLDKLDEKFDRKFEKLDRRVDEIDKELSIYNEELKIHVQGVVQAREENRLLKEYIDTEQAKLSHKVEAGFQKIEQEIAPTVEQAQKFKHVSAFLIKALGFISLFTGAMYGLGRFFNVL